MIDLSAVDLEELAMALEDQDGYEHHWLIDPGSGQISLWTEDGGIDGEHPVDLDEVDLIGIHPLPSHVWYQDMADFADEISDERAGRRFARAIRGKGAFRRFKDELYEEYPELLPAWFDLSDEPPCKDQRLGETACWSRSNQPASARSCRAELRRPGPPGSAALRLGA